VSRGDRVRRFEEVRERFGEAGRRAAYEHFCRTGSMPSDDEVRASLAGAAVDPAPPSVPGGMSEPKFWVVRDVKAHTDSVRELLTQESTIDYLREVVGAGLATVEAERHRIHTTEMSALEDVVNRLERHEARLKGVLLEARSLLDRQRSMRAAELAK